MKPQKTNMHIGEQIKRVFDSRPKTDTINWLAGELHCQRRNIYDIFNRQNIDIELLRRICKVLEHDFFKDLSDNLSEE